MIRIDFLSNAREITASDEKKITQNMTVQKKNTRQKTTTKRKIINLMRHGKWKKGGFNKHRAKTRWMKIIYHEINHGVLICTIKDKLTPEGARNTFLVTRNIIQASFYLTLSHSEKKSKKIFLGAIYKTFTRTGFFYTTLFQKSTSRDDLDFFLFTFLRNSLLKWERNWTFVIQLEKPQIIIISEA